MKIDLSEIKKESGVRIPVSGNLEQTSISFMGEEYLFSEPLSVEGFLTNHTENLHFEAKVTGHAQVHCARCMRPMEVSVSFRIDEFLAEEGASHTEEEEDLIFYSGDVFSPDELIVNSFLAHVPSRFLCREDCMGLCPHCGKDLNEGECDCHTEEIDPRWAALAKIMEETSDTK